MSENQPYYAAYVVNGLQSDSSGIGIRDMRGNNRDKKDRNKAFGGSLGTEIGKSASIAVNYYRGAYSEDGNLGLDIYGVSGHFDNCALSFYGALHLAQQEAFMAGSTTDTETLSKNGFYLQGAYKFANKLEPVIRYDQITLDGAAENNRQRISLGLNYHLFSNAVLKAHYDIISDDGADIDDNVLSFQFAVGF
ncbi:MAG: hypothetical protein ACI81T_000272 [Bacteroidia bacterium]